jgi:hypothetical protein
VEQFGVAFGAVGPILRTPEVDERLVIVDGWVMKKSELPQEQAQHAV